MNALVSKKGLHWEIRDASPSFAAMNVTSFPSCHQHASLSVVDWSPVVLCVEMDLNLKSGVIVFGLDLSLENHVSFVLEGYYLGSCWNVEVEIDLVIGPSRQGLPPERL